MKPRRHSATQPQAEHSASQNTYPEACAQNLGYVPFPPSSFFTILINSQFLPAFTATIQQATNYVTRDPNSNLSRIIHSSLIVPDDGSLPFQMQATGIQVATPEVLSIVTGSGKGVQVPFGGVDSGDYFYFLVSLPSISSFPSCNMKKSWVL